MVEIRDRNISDELELNPGCAVHYGRVILMDNGYIRFTGDGSLEIDELICQKEEAANTKYEFLIQPPDGAKGEPGSRGEDAGTASVVITVHCLKDTVRMKSIGGNGGNGGDGMPGGDGGCGGDSACPDGCGGCGGNGGGGGRGGDGGNGGTAPSVTVTYASENETAEILVLTRENTPCPGHLSYGGRGGLRGAGGKGGKGGRGGLNGDGSRAEDGICGRNGEDGLNDGADAADGFVTIIRTERRKF